jgi:ribosomal protein S18 acetylase RimI-like enzyme
MDRETKRKSLTLTVEESPAEDRDAIAELARRAEVFTPEEEETVLELFDAYISSADSGYAFLSARANGELAGFACWGSTPLTEGTYDLYWICSDPDLREQGVGRRLFEAVEGSVRAVRGRMMIIETSTGDAYLPAVRFYEHMGCRQAARIPDYYRPGEDLLVYVKNIPPSTYPV